MAHSPTEIKELLKNIQNKFGYTLLEISQKVGVTEAALSRWNNGKSEPTRKNLERLKQFASGSTTAKNPMIGGNDMEEIRSSLRALVGDMAIVKSELKELRGGQNGQIKNESTGEAKAM